MGTTSLVHCTHWIVASISLCALLTVSATAQTIQPVATAPQAVAVNPWISLTPAQKLALTPLAADWDTLDADRKKKWLVFAEKFQKMSPDEQKRVHEKMQAWVQLTPEQRLAARENYIRSNKLQPDQRSLKWQEYQQLPAEQKEQLATHEAKKSLITNLPTPEESRANKLQPLKKPHKIAPPEANNLTSAPALAPVPVKPTSSEPSSTNSY